jgi:hypothetical protein
MPSARIGTNAIPNLLKMVSKTESPRMGKVTDFGNPTHREYQDPTCSDSPSILVQEQTEVSEHGREIGFKILGADADEAVP